MNLAGGGVEILLPPTIFHKCSELLELFHDYLFARFEVTQTVNFVLGFSGIVTVVENDVIAAIPPMINEHGCFKWKWSKGCTAPLRTRCGVHAASDGLVTKAMGDAKIFTQSPSLMEIKQHERER